LEPEAAKSSKIEVGSPKYIESSQAKPTGWFSFTYLALIIAMIVYLFLRAINVPLVFDEATTYFLYVKTGDYLPGAGFWSANNHYLNSFLIWLKTVDEDRVSAFNLRFSNLAAFGLFAGWLIQIANTLKSNILRFLLLPAIFSVHYMMEFFAYARGYGLALAFLAGSLWFLQQWHATRKISKLYKLSGCIFLMVAASISTLPAAGMIVLAAVFVQLKSRKNWLASVPAFIIMTASLIGGAYITNTLSSKGELYYGGNKGLWNTTIASLQEVFFNTQGSFFEIVFVLLSLSILASSFFAGWNTWQTKTFDIRFFPLLIVLVALLFYVFANMVLGVLYPIDRAVLYLVLLSIIALFFTVDVWAEHTGNLWPMLLLLPLIVFPATFYHKISLESASANSWSIEQMPESFCKKLVRTNHTVGGYFLRQPQWNFLNLNYPKPVFCYTKTSPTNTDLDYVLAGKDHLPNYADLYHAIDTNASQNLFLLQRNSFLKRLVIDSISLFPEDTIAGDLIFHTKKRDDFGNLKALEIELDMESLEPQFAGVLAISGFDAENNAVFWYDVRIGNLNYRTDFREKYSAFVPLESLPENLTSLSVFLWNLEQEKVIVYRATVKYIDLIEP